MELKLEERIEELAERLVACWDIAHVEVIPNVVLLSEHYPLVAGDHLMSDDWAEAFDELQAATRRVILTDPETRKAAMLEVARFIARERLRLAGFDEVAP
ncbi:MAG: hypothetical protein P8011_00055 [Acidihalobacter sp.]|uniref:hypothetical protein n=1 Tax=Acidihalobacter sp. TaxID=1872108 RepID=UPI00307F3DE4